MTTEAAPSSTWRFITSGSLVLAAVFALIAVALGGQREFPFAWPVLAVALTVAAFGQPRESARIGRMSLSLFALGYAIQVLVAILLVLPGIPPLGWPILVIAISSFTAFGLAVILGLAHVIGMIPRRTDRTERPVSLVPTMLGVTAFSGLIALFLPRLEWLGLIFPVACVVSAVYLMRSRPRAA